MFGQSSLRGSTETVIDRIYIRHVLNSGYGYVDRKGHLITGFWNEQKKSVKK